MGIDTPRRGKRLAPGTPPVESLNIRCEQGHPAWRQVTGPDGERHCLDCDGE